MEYIDSSISVCVECVYRSDYKRMEVYRFGWNCLLFISEKIKIAGSIYWSKFGRDIIEYGLREYQAEGQ